MKMKNTDQTLICGEILVELCNLQLMVPKLSKRKRKIVLDGIKDLQDGLVTSEILDGNFLLSVLQRIWKGITMR